MTEGSFHSRLATLEDLPALRELIHISIRDLVSQFLAPAQVEASFEIMGLDTQLIEDGTYFIVDAGDRIAGCGGWSRRATLFGPDRLAGRDARLLDPKTEPARIRAMYTHPDFARRGVGRLILSLCEAAAEREGFRALEMMATAPGEPLYLASGYSVIERMEMPTSKSVAVPCARMSKELVASPEVQRDDRLHCMFDTNVFNRILDGVLPIPPLRDRVVVYATHIQRDEINNTSGSNRRHELMQVFGDVLNNAIPTDSAVCGVSRLGGSRIGGNRVVPTVSAVYGVSKYGGAKYGAADDLYSAIGATLSSLNNAKPNNTQDALIAETAVKQELTLVTDDADLAAVTRAYGGSCFSVAELMLRLWPAN